MAADRLTAPSGDEEPSSPRSNSSKKHEVLSNSLSVSTPASVYRQLRQHRNSWPTIEAAATAAAKAIKRKYTMWAKK